MNLPDDGTSSKNLSPFTRALAPPFIGRRRDFYIPKTPSNSKHIYKPATSSHSKPGLFGTTTLTLLLRRFVNFSAHDFQSGLPIDSRISCPPKLAPLPVRGSRLPRVHDSESSPIQDPQNSHVRESEGSQFKIPENREFPAPEKHISRTSLNSTFRG
jgi:hypothetical protein